MTFDYAEETAVREFLSGRGSSEHQLEDDLHRRLVQAVQGDSDLDVAVLIRQWIRRLSERDEQTYRAQLSDDLSGRLRTHSASVGLESQPGGWVAHPYRPSWTDEERWADEAAVAGSHAGLVATAIDIAADPFFTRHTGWPTYRSPGQRAAARAAVSMQEGSTLMTLLPTGSGKTEVALCLAGRQTGGVTLIVVPTVALAYDFERRFRAHFVRLQAERRRKVDPAEFTFAWTGETSESDRLVFRSRLTAGMQPLLVTSPESISTSLRTQLLDLAVAGRLAGIVIDEAHLVTQWGRSFRPDYRAFALLRQDLLAAAAANERARPVTLLLSATINSQVASDLYRLFSTPGPMNLIAANSLRVEPEFWIAPVSDQVDQRDAWVLEAIAHLPRPLVLYVTQPSSALDWYRRLQNAGYSRVVAVTGESSGDERRQVLAGLRTDGDKASMYDVVVATSAFGLGIDYGHIRSVVHACLPETLDRWYQEVGRGGRDGHKSVAMLLASISDYGVAESLGVKVLRPPTAKGKWADLRRRALSTGDGYACDLARATGNADAGSYNLRWNSQLVQGMVELGALEAQQITYDVAKTLGAKQSEDEHPVWFGFRERLAGLNEDDWWLQEWQPWQAREMATSRGSLNRMKSVAENRVAVCTAIRDEYAPESSAFADFGESAVSMETDEPCGRCPQCRATGVPRRTADVVTPLQRWSVDKTPLARLNRLIAAIGTDDGLGVIICSDPVAFVASVAPTFREIGVRHFAGVGSMPHTMESIEFVDANPIGPMDLSPYPSCVVMQDGDLARTGWLSRHLRLRSRPDPDNCLDILVVSPRVILPTGLHTRTEHTCRALLGVAS